MKYKKINNPGLGLCHVLKENGYGYLIYSEKNSEHFIIVGEIKDNTFYFNQYFRSLEHALEYFDKLGRNEL